MNSQPFLRFLRSPSWNKVEEGYVYKDYLLFVVKAVGITLAGAFLILMLNSVVFSAFGINAQEYYLPLQDIRNQSLVDIVFYFVIFAPVVEEIMFRLWILPNKTHLALGSVLMSAGLLLALKANYWWLIASVAVGLLSLLIKPEVLRSHAYLLLVTYFSSVVFAIAHITNYTSLPSDWVLIPLLVLPQFWTGLCFAYARLQAGLQWSVLTHALYNAIVLAITLLLRAY